MDLGWYVIGTLMCFVGSGIALGMLVGLRIATGYWLNPKNIMDSPIQKAKFLDWFCNLSEDNKETIKEATREYVEELTRR